VALEKEDFLGKEALAKVKAAGPGWKLCTFTLMDEAPLMIQGSAPIIHGGKVLGVTTSAGYGHTVKKNICYAYIPAEDAQRGDGFEIEVYSKMYPLKLEPSRVLYDPKREKILG
jgi:4-methylaminobutanoate oxidase (formaldehyde-forming)